MEEGEWRIKDGSILKIKDMEDSHKNNCLRILENELNRCEEFEEAFSSAPYELQMGGFMESMENSTRIRLLTNKIIEFKQQED